MVREFLDVVHQTIELPLPVDLGSPAQREAIELLVVAQIAEHRLHRREAPAVTRSALGTVNALTHLLRMFKRRANTNSLYLAISHPRIVHLHIRVLIEPFVPRRLGFFYGLVKPHRSVTNRI